ncbi:MAG TPA: rhomboid family intramembrane serine protease, partial [Longimicrobiaceae bacterium]|nr:rhomboid family intramembrane serine protease [Longimicrobiaceae bacterium]
PAGPFARDPTPLLVPHIRDFVDVFSAEFKEIRRQTAGQPLQAEVPAETPAPRRAEAAPTYDWRVEDEVGGKPPVDSEYGCYYAGVYVACSREELARWCAERPTIGSVWTPETDGLARPEKVPFLVEAYRTHALRKSRRTVLRSSLVLAGSLALLRAMGPDAWRSVFVLIPAFSAVKLLTGAYELREARGAGPHVFAQHRAAESHRSWVMLHRPRLTLWILGCLAAVMVVRMAGGGAALQAAGLVKPAVWEGEAWRLLTGPLLHLNVLHILMNAAALFVLGPVIEVHARRGILPLVFLVSALGGSLLSLVVHPDTSSVGASGGIMGMMGFLGVLALRHGDQLPPGFFSREIALSIAATAVLGIVGIQLIDNAAHAGGLLTGALLGLFLAEPRRDPEPWTRRAGQAALAVTFAGGALAVWLMILAIG